MRNNFLVLLPRRSCIGALSAALAFLNRARAPLHFRLQILSQAFGNNPGRGKIPDVGDREFGKVRKHGRKRS